MLDTSPLAAVRTVYAGAPGPTVHCGLMDTLLADLPVSLVFCYDRPLDPDTLAAGLAVALRFGVNLHD